MENSTEIESKMAIFKRSLRPPLQERQWFYPAVQAEFTQAYQTGNLQKLNNKPLQG